MEMDIIRSSLMIMQRALKLLKKQVVLNKALRDKVSYLTRKCDYEHDQVNLFIRRTSDLIEEKK